MHDAAFVRERQRPAELREDLDVRPEAIAVTDEQGLPRIMLGIFQQRSPRHAVDPLHHEQRGSRAVDSQGVHRHEARMLERARDPRLADEGARGTRILGARDLERDLAPDRSLLGDVHHAHAAATDLARDHEVRAGVAEREGR